MELTKRNQIFALVLYLLGVGASYFFSVRLAYSVRDISDKYIHLFTPAALTFSIWGLIYALGFIVILLNKIQTKTLFYYYLALTVLNTVWILFWVNEWMIAAWLVLGLMLVLLCKANYHTEIAVDGNSQNQQISVAQAYFQIYLGWVSVAFTANTASLFVFFGLPPFGLIQTAITIAIVSFFVIAIFFQKIFDTWLKILVLAWTLLGIILHSSMAEALPYQLYVRISCGVALAAIAVFFLIQKKNCFNKDNNL